MYARVRVHAGGASARAQLRTRNQRTRGAGTTAEKATKREVDKS